eukprot:11097317-Alexandrium_andersonii.AAC.1
MSPGGEHSRVISRSPPGNPRVDRAGGRRGLWASGGRARVCRPRGAFAPCICALSHLARVSLPAFTHARARAARAHWRHASV